MILKGRFHQRCKWSYFFGTVRLCTRHLRNPSDGQRIRLGDLRFAGQLAPDGAMVPTEQTGESCQPAHAVIVVERKANGSKLGRRHALRISVFGSSLKSVKLFPPSGSRDSP